MAAGRANDPLGGPSGVVSSPDRRVEAIGIVLNIGNEHVAQPWTEGD